MEPRRQRLSHIASNASAMRRNGCGTFDVPASIPLNVPGIGPTGVATVHGHLPGRRMTTPPDSYIDFTGVTLTYY